MQLSSLRSNRPKICLILSLTSFGQLLCFVTQAKADELPASVPSSITSPEGMQSYHSHWQNFVKRQEEIIAEGHKKYQASWQNLAEKEAANRLLIDSKLRGKLKEAAANYRQQLLTAPNSDNRPYALLNLAQTLYLLAEASEADDGQTDPDSEYRSEALQFLTELRTSYRYFAKWDFSLYLLANLYTTGGARTEALKVWKELAATNIHSVYHAYAHTAIGDAFFLNEAPQSAQSHYEKALAEFADLKSSEAEQDRLLVEYRLAWAAYRAGSLAKVLSTCRSMLAPNRFLATLPNQEKLRSDALLLAGDALYELSEVEDILTQLAPSTFGSETSALGLFVLQKFVTAKRYQKAIQTGTFLLEAFPLSRELPSLLDLTAQAFQESEKSPPGVTPSSLSPSAIEQWEQLALLLPENSLWRGQYQNEPKTISHMELLAQAAALKVADWHFLSGQSSGLARHYRTAAAYYGVLSDFQPAAKEAPKWRLTRAHCYYFGEFFDEAAIQYSNLAADTKLDKALLAEASYQLVLSYEKLWRKSFREALEKKGNLKEAEASELHLIQIGKAVDHYARHFPEEGKATDLLLVVASANRDQGKYEEAIAYWQKALLAKTNSQQKKLAIRGIIFATVQSQSQREVIAALRQFLELENWQELGKSMQNELLALLSQAAIEQGQSLATEGKGEEAGTLLLSIARELPTINKRALLLRDGSYYLAIAGLWQEAQQASLDFLGQKHKNYGDDMTYLLARSYEYQLRFRPAVEAYLRLGLQFPKYSKAQTGLARAESLAEAEDLWLEAGKAANQLANLETSRKQKILHQQRALRHYLQGKLSQGAIKTAKDLLDLQTGADEKLTTQLLLAKAYLLDPNKIQGLNLLITVSKKAESLQKNMPVESWAPLVAEAEILLAEETSKNFFAIDLWAQRQNLAFVYPLKQKAFATTQGHYDAAIKRAQAPWLAEARYKLADLAEKFADELALVAFGNKPAEKTYTQEITRLKTLAKQLFAQNALLAQKATAKKGPTLDNPWERKALWRAFDPLSSKDPEPPQPYLPPALHLDLPYQWSL